MSNIPTITDVFTESQALPPGEARWFRFQRLQGVRKKNFTPEQWAIFVDDQMTALEAAYYATADEDEELKPMSLEVAQFIEARNANR